MYTTQTLFVLMPNLLKSQNNVAKKEVKYNFKWNSKYCKFYKFQNQW